MLESLKAFCNENGLPSFYCPDMSTLPFYQVRNIAGQITLQMQIPDWYRHTRVKCRIIER